MNTRKAVLRLAQVIRRKDLALATERSYCALLRRYCAHLKTVPPNLPSEHKIERFLTALATNGIAASTQNQAFNALLFYQTGETIAWCI
jgi:hypothetical protein